MSAFLAGKKTYISLAIVLLGVLGFGDLVSEGELAEGIDAVLKVVGLAGAVYGRAVAKPKAVEG